MIAQLGVPDWRSTISAFASRTSAKYWHWLREFAVDPNALNWTISLLGR
jgi:hypothetical protein